MIHETWLKLKKKWYTKHDSKKKMIHETWLKLKWHVKHNIIHAARMCSVKSFRLFSMGSVKYVKYVKYVKHNTCSMYYLFHVSFQLVSCHCLYCGSCSMHCGSCSMYLVHVSFILCVMVHVSFILCVNELWRMHHLACAMHIWWHRIMFHVSCFTFHVSCMVLFWHI